MDILLYYENSKEKENEMTVKELVEILSQLDGDMEIMVSQNGGEYEGDFSGEVTVDNGKVWFLD